MGYRNVGALLVLALAAIGCEPADDAPATQANAQQAAAVAMNEPPAWEDELYDMVHALDLTIAEEDAVRAAYEQRDADVRAFMESERGRQLSDDEAALAEAARAGNLSKVREITGRAGGDRDALRQIIRDGKRRIREALPEDKRVAWDAYQVSAELLELMEPLGLDLDQQLKIEDQAVVSMEAALARNEPNPMAAAFLSIEKWAENAVLTPTQRRAYTDVKQENPLRSLRF